MVWTYIFSGDSYGMLNSLLLRLGLIADPIQWLNDPAYNSIVVIVVILWMSMGAGFLSFVAGFQQLNVSLFEAGAIDGVRNRWQELWHITLPQMVPQLLIGAVLSISSAFAVGYQNALLTGNPSTDYSTHTVLLHMTDYGYTRFEMAMPARWRWCCSSSWWGRGLSSTGDCAACRRNKGSRQHGRKL